MRERGSMKSLFLTLFFIFPAPSTLSAMQKKVMPISKLRTKTRFDVKNFCCPYCFSEFLIKTDFYIHLISHVQVKKTGTNIPGYEQQEMLLASVSDHDPRTIQERLNRLATVLETRTSRSKTENNS